MDSDSIIIVVNSVLAFLSPSYLKKLSRQNKLVLLLVDSYRNRPECETSKIKYFGNNVFTFDPEDALKYGFNLTQSYYSMIMPIGTDSVHKGVYFCGAKKDKLAKLHSAYKLFKDNSIDCDFNIMSVPKDEQVYDGINYMEQNIPYKEYIKSMQTMSCIFDVTQNNQTGVTIRYYEAVCYNKKLITDNQLVKKLPFYNPDYIQVYDKVENIDVDWIKKDIEIDYGYDGRFSPDHFLEELKLHFQKKEHLV